MKLLYLLDEDISKENGVVQKVKSQISIWESKGLEVYVVSMRSSTSYSALKNSTILYSRERDKSLVGRVTNFLCTSKLLEEYLKKIVPDVIYSRYFLWRPGIVNTLRKWAPCVLEINTLDIAEFKARNKIAHYYNLLTRHYLLNYCDKKVFVTNEIAQHPSFAKFNKDYIVIGNGGKHVLGIDFNNKPSKNITFIGSENQIWHGVDKLVFLIDNLKEYRFVLIGLSEEQKIKFGSMNNVDVYGFLKEDEADSLILNSIACISSLAMHRINLNEGSPLKTRHYLSLGKPVILGYNDTDLINTKTDFILNIGNHENNVKEGIGEIRVFLKKIANYDSKKILDFYALNLSTTKKEIERIKFILK